MSRRRRAFDAWMVGLSVVTFGPAVALLPLIAISMVLGLTWPLEPLPFWIVYRWCGLLMLWVLSLAYTVASE